MTTHSPSDFPKTENWFIDKAQDQKNVVHNFLIPGNFSFNSFYWHVIFNKKKKEKKNEFAQWQKSREKKKQID